MIRRLLTLLAGLVLVIAGGVYLAIRLSIAEPGGTFDIEGLSGDVEIRFDEFQRPFVDAGSLDDAFLAEGWLHARYRLWQMELLRRAGSGRLAQGLGESLLSADESLWRAGVPQLAARLQAQASPATLASIDAYVAGVNAGIATYSVAPPEFLLARLDLRRWTRNDVFAVGALIAFQSANNMGKERLRLSLANALDDDHLAAFLPDETRTPGFPYVIRDPKLLVASRFVDSLDAFEQLLLPNASLGSSGWAVAASRSATGNALFAFDSHDALNLPNLFYEVHLFYGREKSVRGWSLQGLPGVINGFNEHLAWGMTNIGDTQDLYVETRNPDSPLEFLLDGEWYEAEVQVIEIPVQGRNTPHRIEILTTANGPLVEEDPAVSLRWSGHDTAGRGLEALFAMNTAASWEEFEAALDWHAAPTANITYADRDGRIAFRTIGLIPVRGAGTGLFPLAGDDSANAWKGYVSDEELPELVDPQYGYVAAANARVHEGLPMVSADNAPGYRMQRLHTVLSGRGDFALDDMAALQLDEYNAQAAKLLPHMLPEQDLWPDETDLAIDWLGDWLDEPLNSAESAGALIWEHWYPALARRVFDARLDDDLLRRLLRESYVLNHALDRLVVEDHDSPWWQGQRETILHETLGEVVGTLSVKYGSDPRAWRWDAEHSVSFRHELHGVSRLTDSWLSRGPYPWGGGHPVLARARYTYDRPFEGRAGATVRVVAEMSTPMQVRAVIPGGQHGHPSSDHYDDQLEIWLGGALLEIATTPADVSGPATRLRPKQLP